MAEVDLDALHVAVVGSENNANMRLVNTLIRFVNPDQVFRPLTLKQMEDFTAQHRDQTTIILFDLLAFDLVQATTVLSKIRAEYPDVIFMLWLDKVEYDQVRSHLPGQWADRFEHYFKIYKVADDTGFEPILRRKLAVAAYEATSKEKKVFHSADKIFISYAHADWDTFVSGFVKRLTNTGFQVWVDQHLLVGGNDWVDSIAQALEECKVLILVMTPEALASRYVKMEYRYFFNYDKPIIPLLYKPVKSIPVELISTQYIDFRGAGDAPYQHFLQAIKQYIAT